MTNSITMNYTSIDISNENSLDTITNYMIMIIKNITQDLIFNLFQISEREIKVVNDNFKVINLEVEGKEEINIFIKTDLPIFSGTIFKIAGLINNERDELSKKFIEDAGCFYSKIWTKHLTIKDKKAQFISDSESLSYKTYVSDFIVEFNKKIDNHKIFIEENISKVLENFTKRNDIGEKKNKMNVCIAINNAKSYLTDIKTALLKIIESKQKQMDEYKDLELFNFNFNQQYIIGYN